MNAVQKHLLTPLKVCKVKIDGREGHTRNMIMKGGEGRSLGKRFPLVQDETMWLAKRYRVHHRVVFKEIAQPIYKVVRLSDVLSL